MCKTPRSLSYKPFFNANRDFERVVPNLSVDVGEIMATGVVASTGDTTPYTKETEIGEIGHYITDKIQGVMAAMRLNKSVAGASTSNTKTSSTSKEGE